MNKNEIITNGTAIYYNSIGILIVKIILNIENENEFEKLKFFHKCEDGKLTLVIKNSFLKLKEEISIYFSNSMRVNFNDTQITIDKVKKEICSRYLITKELLNKDTLFDKLNNLHISECFDNISNNMNDMTDMSYVSDVSDVNEDKLNWHDVECVDCKNCGSSLIGNIDTTKQKLIYNFNYDYFGNLEMLSCHEADIENIIPNLDEKLKSIVNISNLSLQINNYITEQSKCNYLIRNEVNIFCGGCKIQIGDVDFDKHKMNFSNFYLPLIDFKLKNKKDFKANLNMEKYLKLLILYSVLESKTKLMFKQVPLNESISDIILYINPNLLYIAEINQKDAPHIKINKENFNYFITTEFEYLTTVTPKITNTILTSSSEIQFNLLPSQREDLLSLLELNQTRYKNIIDSLNKYKNNFIISLN